MSSIYHQSALARMAAVRWLRFFLFFGTSPPARRRARHVIVRGGILRERASSRRGMRGGSRLALFARLSASAEKHRRAIA